MKRRSLAIVVVCCVVFLTGIVGAEEVAERACRQKTAAAKAIVVSDTQGDKIQSTIPGFDEKLQFDPKTHFSEMVFDAQGQPVSGTHDLLISYFAKGGAEPVWEESLPRVDFDSGRFDVVLGTGEVDGAYDTASLRDVFRSHPEMEMQVAIDGVVQAPRVGLLPAGHSNRSRALLSGAVSKDDDDSAMPRSYRSEGESTAIQAADLHPAGKGGRSEDPTWDNQDGPYLLDMLFLGVSIPVREMRAPVSISSRPGVSAEEREINPLRHETVFDADGYRFGTRTEKIDDLRAQESRNAATRGTTPALIQSFPGIGRTGYAPPDTEGAVGPNHYAQVVNVEYMIYDKTGTELLANPLATNSLWDGMGGACDSDNDGDAIFLYDEQADRWVLTQFAVSSATAVCFAVSTTADPTGSYYLYQLDAQRFPDYYKLGVWPDAANNAYFMGTNSGSQNQYDVYAIDRASLLAGSSPNQAQYFQSYYNLMMPADIDGDTLPPSGSPGIFYTFRDGGESYFGSPSSDSIDIYEFDVDWSTPSNSTFTLAQVFTPSNSDFTDFNWSVCGFFVSDCLPQPGTTQEIDSASWWPMQRLQYRNQGAYETLVGTWTVDTESSGDHAAPRWFELRRSGASWTFEKEGTLSPDTTIHRFMPSIALDGSGNMAIGYSVVNGTSVQPGLRYATRDRDADFFNSESVMIAGSGIETSANRWGDYASMEVDPSDDCTFWFTSEYIASSGAYNWSTQVASFKVPDCTGLICDADAPTGLNVYANGDNRIDMTWNAAAGATEYRVYRSQTSGGPYSPVGTVTAPTTFFSDTTVSGLVTYYYVVTNFTDCESGLSNEDFDSTTGTCSLPPDFDGLQSVTTPQAPTCTLDLSWNAATALCGGSISYNVYRDTTQGFDPDLVAPLVTGVSGTTYSDADNLVSGTTYYYVVRAVDSSNSVEDSNTVEDSGVPFGPSVDGTFTAGAETGDNMYSSGAWSISSARAHSGSNSYHSGYDNSACAYIYPGLLNLTAGQSSVLTYWTAWDIQDQYDGGVVEISTDGGSTWTTLTPTPGYPGSFRNNSGNACGYPRNQPCYTQLGNLTFTQYTIDLSAYNGQSVLVVWWFSTNASTNSGEGWYLDDISITHVSTPSSCTTGGSCTNPGAVTIGSITDDDACVQDGVTITFSGGAGASSFDLWVDGAQTVTGISSPYAYDPGDTASHSYVVRAIDSSCFTDSSASNFTDAGLGTPAITSITDDDECAQTGIHVNYTGGTDATSHDLLRNGTPVVTGYVSGALYNPGNSTSYTYTIRANMGACTAISGGSAFADAADAPGTPAITSITDDDTCAQSGIHVNYSTGSGATSHNLVRNGSVVVTGYVSGALYNPGDSNSYSYVVRAVNGSCTTDSGSSSFSDENSGLAAPGVPSVTDDDACSQSGVTVTWGAVSGATGYEVRVDGTTTVYSGPLTSIGYDPGNSNSHTYDVRASNASCTSVWSGVATATDEAGAPGTPGAPTVADAASCGLTGVQISWGAVSGATSYDLLVDGTTTVVGVTSPSTYAPGDSSSHTYAVRAVNVCGDGAWSTATAGIDADHSFTWAGLDTAADRDACDDTGVALRWSTPASWNDGGAGTRTFTTLRDGGTLASGISETTIGIDDTSGVNGTSYDYSVLAVNGYGCSAGGAAVLSASDEVGSEPTFGGLQSVTAMPGDVCGLRLEWNSATSNCSNGPTIVYNVYRSETAGFTPDGTTLHDSCVPDLYYEDHTVFGGTTYYYVVRAEDSSLGHGGPCGNGFEDTNTTEVGGAASGGTLSLYSENFDGFAAGDTADWAHEAFAGSDFWSDVRACTASSSPNVFRFGSTSCSASYSSDSDAAAYPLPGGSLISVPTGATGVTLSFAHDWDFAVSDGASLWLASSGTYPTFHYIGGTYLSGQGYTGTSNGDAGFTGSSGGFGSTQVDLSQFCSDNANFAADCAGENLYVAFNVFSDVMSSLYDQSVTPSGGKSCQDFETIYNAYDSEGAADFVVPAGGWLIERVDIPGSYSATGPLDSVDVIFYTDNSGYPDAVACSNMGVTGADLVDSAGDLQATLPVACDLPAGTYWLGIQGNMDYSSGGQWYWTMDAVQSTGYGGVWRNPGDGFSTGCTSWIYLTTCDATSDPDYVFSLHGHLAATGWNVDDVELTYGSGASCTTAANPVQHFAARSTSETVKLEWQNPELGAYTTTRICVDGSAYPTNPSTCTLAAPDQSTGLNNYDTMTLTGLTNGSTYYYTAFVDNGAGEYSPAQTVMARPFNTSGQTKWSYHTSATALAPPGLYPGAAGTGASYGVSNDRVLHGMNSTDGGGDWPRTTPFAWMPMGMNGPAQDRPPIVPTTAVTANGGGDLVAFLGSQDGHVYAANAKTGVTLWQSTQNYGLIQGAPSGMFSEYGGTYDLIFAGSRVAGSGNSMYGINLADGTPAWSFGGTMGIISSGATVDYANNRLYFASRENPSGSSNTLWCLQFTDGGASQVWAMPYGDIDSAPVLYDGVLYIGTNAGVIAAIDPATGGKIWSYATDDGPLKGYVDFEFVTGGPRQLFFATTTSVWSLTDNGASATFEWQQPGVVGPSIPLTLADQGAMYVGSTDGRLYQLNASTGAIATSAMLGDGTATVGSPGYDWMNSLAYVGAEDGSVYAVILPLQ